MNEIMKKLSGPKKLALVAFALGLIAMFAGNPYDNVNTTINSKDIAYSSMNSADKISVSDLADWLIQNKADYVLIDLRNEAAYKEYFIPNAVNILPISLLNSGLMRNDKFVLYSDDNTEAAQAWYLLKSRDYKSVYILDGGLKSWKENIIFPSLAADASPEQVLAFEKIKQISLHFGGTPQSGAETVTSSFKMPELKAPAQTTLTTAPKKKKREGC